MGNKRETRDAGREKENEHKASMDEDELLNKVEASALAHCQLHLNTKETANTKNTKKKKKTTTTTKTIHITLCNITYI